MHEMPELPSHTFAPHLHVTQPVDQPWMLDFPGSHFQSSPMQQSHFPQFQQTRNAAQVGAQLQGYGQPATDYHGFGQVAEALDMTLKEKNRRAQKKCREKIKAKQSEAEIRNAHLQKQLQELKAQTAAAESRNLMLEKMLVLDKLASKEDKVVLHDSIPAVKSEALETNFHNPVNFPTDLDSALKSRAQQPPLLQYTMDQLDTLEFDDHANLWKEYINRLALCLVEANGDEGSPACNKITDIVEELTTLFQHLVNHHPKRTINFIYTRLEGNSLLDLSSPDSKFWQKVTKAVNYDERQQQYICVLRDMLTASMGNILKERREIGAQLSSAVALLGDFTLHRQIPSQMQAALVCERLRHNLQQAQECMTQFQIACSQVTRPLQSAMALLQAFPYVPDSLAICNAVAESWHPSQ